MRLITDLKDLQQQRYDRSILTLGNFDGLHRGHQELINMVITRARETGAVSMVVTFRPHPLKILCPEKCPPLISIYEEKIKLIGDLGIDVLVKIPFTLEFAGMAPEAFVRDVLCHMLGAREIFVGANYRFGRERKGTVQTLSDLGRECGFIVREVEQISFGGEVISSTKIRQLLKDGEVGHAARLLGRDYAITGVVVRGDGRGRTLGFPTANIAPKHAIIPSHGVYAVRLYVREMFYDGIANIGVRPTFDKQILSIEANLFDFNEDIYGEEISVYFLEKIRDEKKFGSVDELVSQIRQDVEAARRSHGARE
ncbi:MAG: bifunctional riboflavin kinase/FAD synthetase [Nitrospiraceae bacterium]|nr:bifunctional riboflavin kinase/FAD synthetase [Nitrospiraceae bacterium]